MQNKNIQNLILYLIIKDFQTELYSKHEKMLISFSQTDFLSIKILFHL